MHDMVPAASGQMDRNLRVSASDSNLDKDLQGPLSLSPSIEPARLALSLAEMDDAFPSSLIFLKPSLMMY